MRRMRGKLGRWWAAVLWGVLALVGGCCVCSTGAALLTGGDGEGAAAVSPTVSPTMMVLLSPTVSLTATVTLTPTVTPTPTISPTPTVTLTPTVTPTPTVDVYTLGNRFVVVGYTKLVYRRDKGWMAILTRPGNRCNLVYVLPSGKVSKAAGLGDMTAGEDGRCAWSWVIGLRTKAGKGWLVVTVNGVTRERFPITVEP